MLWECGFVVFFGSTKLGFLTGLDASFADVRQYFFCLNYL
jgi:hypothetical protein